jgi:hypothetical protein
MLKHPDPGKMIYIQTDSSYVGIAGVIFQLNSNNEREILQFVSKKLRNCERNYSVIEIESVAILFSLNRWQMYLMGKPF